MLGKWPIRNKLSEMPAWAGGLWIRRVLVRAQEGNARREQRWAFSVLHLRRLRLRARCDYGE
ncbi:MAG TPA: hypothetical protein VJ808_07735 [Gemmatimonadales bacterium]|nr:hypothetical protein [Gemmatimonadales bacterium]